MTTITDKKQYPGEQYLNELITNIEFAARAPVEVVRAMAAELQKRREADGAEPVAWVMADDLRDNAIVSTPAYPCLDDAKERTIGSLIALYAAPPVPVIPAALPENDDEDGHDIDYLEPSEVYSLGRTAGWNACRAAMLQSQGNCIKDGWISCSEQMPDDGRIQFSVSLPAACGGDKYFIDGVFQPLRYERDCEKAVVAAGGVVNWVK
ncbi:hypothetical protein DOD89_09520 [Shigella sonnei]|nr:hypothetical protein [Shigella sonnei]